MIALAFIALSLVLPPAPSGPSCVAQDGLPDHACTPGMVDPAVTLEIICGHRTKERRHVDAEMRAKVLAAYGIERDPAYLYELDHLTPLELGGANDATNLWPEPWADARRKDLAENRAHRLVCSGKMRLEDAQRAFATDWRTIR